MGQIINVLREVSSDPENVRRLKVSLSRRPSSEKFPDLCELPPELALSVLRNLNATDLCLAACVWNGLANDEFLWQGLCKSVWPYISKYTRLLHGESYRDLYLQLDEGTLTFNADAFTGMHYLHSHELLDNNAVDVAKFFHATNRLDMDQMRIYLEQRRDVLEEMLNLQNFKNKFLPNALRQFFGVIRAPNDRDQYLTTLLEKFSSRFCNCNPSLKLSADTVFIVCYALILLSVDLCSPHVKNKMSKREFIRNLRGALPHQAAVNDDFAGHLYDNIYLVGHIAPYGQN